MKKILIILVIGAVGMYGLIAILRGPAREFTASMLSDAQTNETPIKNSFATDSDRDGLSDAKELIYGTDPNNPDTDGDTYEDGQETKLGFDPTISGSYKISENDLLLANLTVQYFEWAREVLNVPDPQLNDEAIIRFLEARGLTSADIPTISDSEMILTNKSGQEPLRTYFLDLSSIRLPEATISYVDLADEIVREKKSELLDDVIIGLDATYALLRDVPVPSEMHEAHRQQLALLKALRNLFVDLYRVEEDPVLLARDLSWSPAIIRSSIELEVYRRDIAVKVGIAEYIDTSEQPEDSL